MVLLGQVKPIFSAEKVVFNLSVLGDFTVSLDSLEKFEKNGEISPDLARYTRYLDEQTLLQFRGVLQKRFPISPVVVSHFTNVGIGKRLLKHLGELIQMEGNVDGFYALRSALVLSASEPEGVSLIRVLRHFPGQKIRLNTDLILKLVQEFATLSDYTKVSINAIAQEATLEAQQERLTNLEQLTDLRNIGKFKTQKQTITFNVNRLRQTNQGFSTHYPLEVDIYLPIDAETPSSPLIVISHGFGSSQGDYGIAEHLASYGFAVIVPRHIGSDLAYRESFLKGELKVTISPMEFVSRPLDIIYLLDELEKLDKTDSQWIKKVNLKKVGVLGHSLGGSTALSLAGANLNLKRISQDCQQKNPLLNISLFLQCRAIYLPQQQYNLTDSRIKAIALAHPLGSSLFGPEEIGKIEIPTLIVGGSNDIVTPVMIEQVHPFIWLKTPHKYLSLMIPGTHFSTTVQTNTQEEGLPEFLIGNNGDLGTPYFQGLAVAFFEVYLKENTNYLPYLSSSYNESISQNRLQIKMIHSLTSNQLEKAYQKTPPTAIYSSPIETKPQSRTSGSIMEELKKTGVLKVALRADAPPFGYINNQGKWTGYCEDWVTSLAKYLEIKHNISTKIEVVQIPSNLDNRFELVRQNQVYLECGPNTIRNDISGVNFSRFFFLTGTQFLVKSNSPKAINFFQSIANMNVGVFKNTTTEQFIKRQYPNTNIITLDDSSESMSGIKALNENKIDTIANDGILLMGEMERQSLSPKNYKIIPDKPLTCEYYGIILPNSDPQWQSIINDFLDSANAQNIWTQWLKSHESYVFEKLDYCINR